MNWIKKIDSMRRYLKIDFPKNLFFLKLFIKNFNE